MLGFHWLLSLEKNMSKKGNNIEIIGFDIDKKRINSLQNNYDSTNEIKKECFNNIKHVSFTHNKNDLKDADVFIVTVPTPIDEKKPNLLPLKTLLKQLLH